MRTNALVMPLAAALALTPATFAATINAGGATFPAPIYQKWFDEYHKLHPDVQINYQSLGSGAGIRQLTEGTLTFGASDRPMRDEEIAKITRFHTLHFPTVLGGVVPAYNIEGVSSEIKFTPETLSGIYLGNIKKWSDPALKKDNPGIRFPNADITVVHRSDTSGTTFVFTDYLAKISPEWLSKVGRSDAVSWPTGLGGKGNEGVAGAVKETPNSIGYIELGYAVQNKILYGEVKNAAGKFVKADFSTVTAAAAGAAKSIPDDFRVSITNAPGNDAYPISTFTWMLIPDKIDDATKRKAIVGFLEWMLTDGQKDAAPLYYAPLPASVVAKEKAQINKIH